MSSKPIWDIFCVVVDNFGDIGVTWRLARQLAAEHGFEVRLWVDDLVPFAGLCPGADPAAPVQYQAGVEVRRWPVPWEPVAPGSVVIEAFACNLPEQFIRSMREANRPILWLNLEYLSAEDWILGCHGLPSLQPCGLPKYFFFPGFQAQSGGVLRERALLASRDAFQADLPVQGEFLRHCGIEPMVGAQRVSLFAYEHAAQSDWFEALASAPSPTQLLIPEGRVLSDVDAWLGQGGLRSGMRVRRGNLELSVLPFLGQDDYDRLLWCCDFNAVRGEESFIRAQWAGRPFVWHIYPQEEDAHWAKLWAFFRLYGEQLAEEPRAALQAFWSAWNAGEGAGAAWSALSRHQGALTGHARAWAQMQQAQGDLAGKLVSFYEDWL